MNKKFLLFLSILLFFLLIIFNFEQVKIITDQFFFYLIDIKVNNFSLFLFALIITNLMIFLTPIPTLPFIVLNGFLLGNFGFFLTYILIIFSSFILFKLSKKFSTFLKKFSFYKNLFIKINNNKNNDLNFFVVASSRYILPYFFHNIFFGSILKKTKVFLFAIIIAEIPIIFVLNKLGKYLNNFKEFESFDLGNIFETEFIFLLIVLFFLMFIISRSSKYLKNKIS